MKEPLEALKSAISQADKSDYPATIVVLARRILNVVPDDTQTWVRLGNTLRQLAKYDEAEEALQMALCYCSKSIRFYVYTLKGLLFKQRGQYQEAVEWFQAVIDAKPDDADGYNYLAGVIARMGDLAEAERINRLGTACQEGCVDEAYLNLGHVLRAQGKLKEALQCYEKAIDLDPNYTAAKHAIEDVTMAIRYNSEGNE
jgi:tetratricopeptide (TPR) repeat protein